MACAREPKGSSTTDGSRTTKVERSYETNLAIAPAIKEPPKVGHHLIVAREVLARPDAVNDTGGLVDDEHMARSDKRSPVCFDIGFIPAKCGGKDLTARNTQEVEAS
jgi:hypothetical protein